VEEIFHGLPQPAVPSLVSSIISVQSLRVTSSRSGFPSCQQSSLQHRSCANAATAGWYFAKNESSCRFRIRHHFRFRHHRCSGRRFRLRAFYRKCQRGKPEENGLEDAREGAERKRAYSLIGTETQKYSIHWRGDGLKDQKRQVPRYSEVSWTPLWRCMPIAIHAEK